jgi:hypothetical protein
MTSDLETTTLRKVNLRLIPFLALLYFAAFIDRVNVSFAALGMNRDLASSSRSGATAVVDSISIRMSGTGPSCRWTIRQSSWIARAASMPVFPWISPRNSAATSLHPCSSQAADAANSI